MKKRLTVQSEPSMMNPAWFDRKGIMVVMAYCVTFLVAAIFGKKEWAIVAPLALLAVIAIDLSVYRWCRRHDESLSNRMTASDPVEWAVHLNGVKVGAILDTRYAAIQQQTFRSGRNAVAQLFNIGHVVLSVVSKLIVSFAVLVVYLMTAWVVFSPESFVRFIQSPQQFGLLSLAASLFVAVSALAIGALSFFDSPRIGFVNVFSADVNRRLRQYCDAPAMGDVCLSQPNRYFDGVGRASSLDG